MKTTQHQNMLGGLLRTLDMGRPIGGPFNSRPRAARPAERRRCLRNGHPELGRGVVREGSGKVSGRLLSAIRARESGQARELARPPCREPEQGAHRGDTARSAPTPATCEASFKQRYRSSDFGDDVNKRLVLRLESDGWKIMQEIASGK